jgi:hypothetical protein
MLMKGTLLDAMLRGRAPYLFVVTAPLSLLLAFRSRLPLLLLRVLRTLVALLNLPLWSVCFLLIGLTLRLRALFVLRWFALALLLAVTILPLLRLGPLRLLMPLGRLMLRLGALMPLGRLMLRLSSLLLGLGLLVLALLLGPVLLSPLLLVLCI